MTVLLVTVEPRPVTDPSAVALAFAVAFVAVTDHAANAADPATASATEAPRATVVRRVMLFISCSLRSG